MIRKYVFKWAMPVAGFANKDSPGFLYYLSINDSWSVSKVTTVRLKLEQNQLVRIIE
jgi:hypothetical protein